MEIRDLNFSESELEKFQEVLEAEGFSQETNYHLVCDAFFKGVSGKDNGLLRFSFSSSYGTYYVRGRIIQPHKAQGEEEKELRSIFYVLNDLQEKAWVLDMTASSMTNVIPKIVRAKDNESPNYIYKFESMSISAETDSKET